MIEESYIKNAILSEADESIDIRFDTDKTYKLTKLFLVSSNIIPDGISIITVFINMNGAELSIRCSNGSEYLIPWDFILHNFEPEYKYYKINK